MTRDEIARTLGFSYDVIKREFERSKYKEGPIAARLKAKATTGTINKIVDYTFEEANFALHDLPSYTKMQHQYLKENFIERKEGFQYRLSPRKKLPAAARQFIYLYNYYNHSYACCNTCTYIAARRINNAGSKFHPYCTLYNVFLNKALPKRDVYRDRCESYKYTKAEPFIWTSTGAQNITRFMKGNNMTLGIDNSEFTSKNEHPEGSIVLLGEHKSEKIY